jgi:hypothetical protein
MKSIITSHLIALSLILTPAACAVELIDPAAFGFGAPGFTFDSEYQAQQDYENTSGGLSLWTTKISAPVAKFGDTRGWLFGLGFTYEWTQADFQGLGQLEQTDLHFLRTNLFFRYEEPDVRWWFLGFIAPGLASEGSDLGSDSFSGQALALLGYDWSPTLKFAVGVFARHGLDETLAVPALGLIWRPEGGFIAQLTPPIITLGYQPNEDWTFSFVGYLDGGEWTLSDNENDLRQIDLTQWRTALSVEKRFGPHWRLAVRGGLSYGGELELRDESERVLYAQDLDPAPFGAVTLRWVF